MDQVVAANSGNISITAKYYYFCIWFCQFQTRCKGDGTSVSGVEGIQFYVAGNSSCTTYTGYNRDLIKVVFFFS